MSFREHRHAACVLGLALLGWAVTLAGQPTVTNPSDATYDPQTGKYFGPNGAEVPAPELPPFLKNRGWTQDPATHQFIDPNGGRIDPSQFYPSPESNPNPERVAYDPATRTYVYPTGDRRPYVELPPYLDARGYRMDQRSFEIFDTDGTLVDPSTLFPPPGEYLGVTYDPRTKKYYNREGSESPPTPTSRMEAEGWRHDPRTDTWIDPSGKRFVPQDLFEPPRDPNPNNLSYDPQTGKYFDEDGNLVPGALPEYMTNQGFRLDASTGDITDPNGRRVSPADLFPAPSPNPGGYTFDANSGKFFRGDDSGALPWPDLPDFMEQRGWRIDFRTGQLVDPQGESHSPSTYYPAPGTEPGLRYDPDTGRFYTPGGVEAPPTLPRTMREMGWRWDPTQSKFVDPTGGLVDPATLCPHPHPEPLPRATPPPSTSPTGGPTSLGEPVVPADPAPALETVSSLPYELEDYDFWYGYDTGQAVSQPTPGTPATPAQAQAHVVQPGENLFRIALRYGTTLQALQRTNGLTDATLFVGQTLTIPASNEFALPSDMPLDVLSLNNDAAHAGRRETSIQLELVFVTRTSLGGGDGGSRGAWQRAPAAPERRRTTGRDVMHLRRSRPGLFEPPETWLEPHLSLELPPIHLAARPVLPPSSSPSPLQGDGAPRVTALFTSLGVSTGAAFEVEFLNDGGRAVDLGATGVVLEPLDERGTRQAREAFQRAARGNPTRSVTADGYCLELLRDPPPAGTVFRVAAPRLQEQFTPMRDIWRAAKQLEASDGLSPDSDPTAYFHSIVQWSVWSKENGFDLESFRDNFIDRTRKNFAAAGQAWTDQVEQAVRQIVPNRWNDIQKVMRGAEALRANITR